MKLILAIAVAASALMPVQTFAQERAGNAALGAVSGALVFGPVGLVAGAVIGYTAGPAIARSWRGERHQPRPRVRKSKRPSHVAARQRAPAAGVVTPQPPVAGAGGPPAQGFE